MYDITVIYYDLDLRQVRSKVISTMELYGRSDYKLGSYQVLICTLLGDTPTTINPTFIHELSEETSYRA